MPTLSPVYVELKAIAGELHAKLNEAEHHLDKMGRNGASSIAKLSSASAMAEQAIGGAAIAIGTESLHLADQWEEAHARMVTAAKNAGVAASSMEAPLKVLEGRMEKFGFTNADVENALSRLLPVTKNMATSSRDLGVAADLAKARHMDLEQATDLLVKVESGRYTQLGRLGIATKDQIAGFKSSADAVAFLSGKFSGQASAASETFKGKMDALHAKLSDVGVKIGMALIPIIEKLADAFMKLIDWMGKHKKVVEAALIVIGAIILIFGSELVAIAAIVAAVIWLWQNWSTIWNKIKEKAKEAQEWIKKHTGLIIALFGPLGIAVELLAHNWSKIWHGIEATVKAVWHVLEPIFSKIAAAVKGIVGVVTKVGGVVGGALGHIPGFAQGGTVPGPIGAAMLAVVHGGEHVTPVGGGGSGGDTYVFNMNGTLVGSGGMAEFVEMVRQAQVRRNNDLGGAQASGF